MTNEPKCSFCDKAESQVEVLIRAPNAPVWICNACVKFCASVLNKKAALAGDKDAP